MALAEGRGCGGLKIRFEVGCDRRERVLAQRGVARGLPRRVPHDLLNLNATANFPEAGQKRDQDGQAYRKLQSGGARAASRARRAPLPGTLDDHDSTTS